VSLVDLLPSLLELAGTPLPEQTEGSSLVPLLRQDSAQARNEAYVEYLAEGVSTPQLMIRQGQYKYIFGEGDPELLYDVQNDPDELHNLATQPEGVEVLEQFRSKRLAKWHISTLRQQVIASQQQRQLVAKALAMGKRTAWDYQPFEDASQQYIRNHKEFWELLRLSRYPAVELPKPVKVIKRYTTAVSSEEVK
jgi:choline-sulfatase